MVDYKEAWDEQKNFLRSSTHWLDAALKTGITESEKADALAQKKIIKIMLDRMDDAEWKIPVRCPKCNKKTHINNTMGSKPYTVCHDYGFGCDYAERLE